MRESVSSRWLGETLGGEPLGTNPLLCSATTVVWASTASTNVLHESRLCECGGA